MQRTCVLWFAFTVVIYFLSTVSTVNGRKCSGRWAIHACYGGNGKRSSPSSDNSLENIQRNKQFILGQLLLRNRSPNPDVISNYPDDTSLLETDNVYPDSSDAAVREQILDRVNSILSDLLLSQRIQDTEHDREPYY